MKIFLNKFVVLVLLLIFSIIGYQIYQINSSFSYKDTNSYFYVSKGNGYISSGGIKKIIKENSKKELVNAGDIVGTIGTSSLGVIEWGDNSITRIGGNSKLEIKEADIKQDLSNIKINFKLIEGKSWSNVVSMFDDNSYFNEEFQDVIAAVRGTVFEVNLDKNYVYVKDHQVNLANINNSNTQIINAGEYFNLDLFEIIKKLDEKAKDILWQNLNENIDRDYLLNLKNNASKIAQDYKGKFNINNYLDSKYKVISELHKENPDTNKINDLIGDMNDDDKNKLYYMLMFEYQKFNIIDSSSKDFARKMLYRDTLMSVANNENKKTILKYSLYDLNDSINSFSGANIDIISSFLGKNSSLINSLGVDTSVVQINKDNITLDTLKSIMGDNFKGLGNIIGIDKLNTLKGENLGDTINNINDAAHEKVNDTLNSIFNSIKK